MDSFIDRVYSESTKCRDMDELYSHFKDSFYHNLISPLDCEFSELRVLLINTPCNGFGDVIFCIKMANYLREWYGCKVHIASSQHEMFLNMGESKKNILKLNSNKQELSCLSLGEIKNITTISDREVDSSVYSIYFVAPMISDDTPNFKNIKRIIPTSNRFNTFYMTEYNIRNTKEIEFSIGVGKNKYGLLFSDNSSFVQSREYITDLYNIKNKYCIAYLAETIDGSIKCFMSFLSLICKKYKHTKFDIVVPEWVCKTLISDNKLGSNDGSRSAKGSKSKLYSILTDKINFNIYTSDEKVSIKNNASRTINIRGDILPLKYADMQNLITHSENDILMTGDQSITDVLSCCYKKNIYYQIAGWKKNFANALSRYLPDSDYSKKSTSCGGISSINKKSNYKKFVENWDFRKLARKKMDSIVLSCIYFRDFFTYIQPHISRKVPFSSVMSKIKNYIE